MLPKTAGILRPHSLKALCRALLPPPQHCKKPGFASARSFAEAPGSVSVLAGTHSSSSSSCFSTSSRHPSSTTTNRATWNGTLQDKCFSHNYASISTHGSAPASAEDATLRALEDIIGPLDTTPLAPPPRPVVVVISGPSGVGKDAVIRRLKELREDLYFVVTATSRPMRLGEKEGRDYFFVSKDKFEEWRSDNLLLEHALVYGEYKGIPRQQVDAALDAGTDVVLRIDVQGAATVRALMPEVVSIFITTTSEDVLVRRLLARKTEQLDKMIVRAQTARQEAHRMNEFDYVVVNEDGKLDECVAQISAIITAEKVKVKRKQ